MAIFGIEVENSEEAYTFFSKTSERLKEGNLVKNPFNGTIKKRGELYILSIKPIYLNFPIVFWPLGLVVFFLFGYGWWMYPLFALGCLSIFWTRYFFFFFLKKGLRKEGYYGKVRLINHQEIIKRGILEWDNRTY